MRLVPEVPKFASFLFLGKKLLSIYGNMLRVRCGFRAIFTLDCTVYDRQDARLCCCRPCEEVNDASLGWKYPLPDSFCRLRDSEARRAWYLRAAGQRGVQSVVFESCGALTKAASYESHLCASKYRHFSAAKFCFDEMHGKVAIPDFFAGCGFQKLSMPSHLVSHCVSNMYRSTH